MTLLNTFSGRASALVSLLGVLAFPLQPALAGDDAKPMSYVAKSLDDVALAYEDRESATAIETHIQAEIIRRFRHRAEAGDSKALLVLGRVYETGRGTAQDFVLAHKWYNLAAANGNQAGALLRDEIASRMTADLILEAQRMAREWLAVQQGGEASATASQVNF